MKADDARSEQIRVIRVNNPAKINQKNNEYSSRFGEPLPALVT